MQSYFTRSVLDRAIKTAIQALILGLFGADIGEQISNSPWPDISGWQSIGLAVMGAVLSVITNVVLGKGLGAKWTPNILARRTDPAAIIADPQSDAANPAYSTGGQT